MTALKAPEAWQPLTAVQWINYVNTLQMNHHRKLAAEIAPVLVPLLMEHGYRDAAYTLEQCAYHFALTLQREQSEVTPTPV